MQGQYSLRSPAVKRLMKEAQELSEPTEQFYAQPLDDNLFEWHFTIRGPEDSDFTGGIYHGRILLPPDYPMKPPSIILLTANGRFETFKKICLSISGHHPESWQPSWSIRTALLAIIGFMPSHGNGAIGSLDYTPEERTRLAKKSQEFQCPECGAIKDLLKPVTEASKAANQEAKELAAQIDFKGEKEKGSTSGEQEAPSGSEGAATSEGSPGLTTSSPTPQQPFTGMPPSPFAMFNPQMFGAAAGTTTASGVAPMTIPPFMHPMFNPAMMRPGQQVPGTQTRLPMFWPPFPPANVRQTATANVPNAFPFWASGANPLMQQQWNPVTTAATTAAAPPKSQTVTVSQPAQNVATSSQTPSPVTAVTTASSSAQQTDSASPSSQSAATSASSGAASVAPTSPATSTSSVATGLNQGGSSSTLAATQGTGLRQRNAATRPATTTPRVTVTRQPADVPPQPPQSGGTVTAILLVIVAVAITILLLRRLYNMNLIRFDYDD